MSNYSSDVSNSLPSPPGTLPEKPPNPYVVGASFTAKCHEPPAPYGGAYFDGSLPYLENLSHPDQLEWCISHPPAQGVTFSEDTRCITITDAIRTGEDCGAQLVLTNTGLVAKIYDPLYYAFPVSDFPRKKNNVSVMADWDYSSEAAAYSEYGSWALDITHTIQGVSVTREVRMILLEYVRGVRMLDLDPDDLTREERENVMRKLIEAEYDLRSAGVRHDDIAPRNVILSTTSNYADPNMRLTLVDYGSSAVYRIRYGGPLFWPRHNPCFEWAGASMWSSWEWLPYNDEERICWVWGIWGNDRDGKYVKVERDLDNSLGKPKEPDYEDSDDDEILD